MNISSLRTPAVCLYALFSYASIFPKRWHEMLVGCKGEGADKSASHACKDWL